MLIAALFPLIDFHSVPSARIHRDSPAPSVAVLAPSMLSLPAGSIVKLLVPTFLRMTLKPLAIELTAGKLAVTADALWN